MSAVRELTTKRSFFNLHKIMLDLISNKIPYPKAFNTGGINAKPCPSIGISFEVVVV
jgi:hypothetical protein